MTHSYQKPRILQVLPALNGGGVERGTVDIAKALSEKNYTSFVASAGGEMVSQLENDNTHHITLPLKTKNPATIWSNAFQLARIIQEHQVDIIHARSRAPAWSAYLASLTTGATYLTTFHSTYGLHPFPKRWYNGVMQKGARVIAASTFIRDHIIKFYGTAGEKIRMIPRGIDMDQFDPNSVMDHTLDQLREKHHLPTAPIILIPGRIVRRKGFHIALKALHRIRHLSWHCLFVGGTDEGSNYQQELETFIRSHNLSERLTFVPYTTSIAPYYALADLVLIPSIVPEAFGRTCVESQAMGKPPIATDIGGHLDTVVHGETGWLIPPEREDLLAEAMTYQLSMSRDKKNAMAIAAREHVMKQFSLSKMCDTTLALYDELAEEEAQR